MIEEDVLRKIQSDFPSFEDQKLIVNLLDDFFSRVSFLEKDRLMRCILFLAEGEVENVEYYLKSCQLDPRDVIMEAEYENDDRRVRDFTKSFE